jgi:hypothetical protein
MKLNDATVREAASKFLEAIDKNEDYPKFHEPLSAKARYLLVWEGLIRRTEGLRHVLTPKGASHVRSFGYVVYPT